MMSENLWNKNITKQYNETLKVIKSIEKLSRVFTKYILVSLLKNYSSREISDEGHDYTCMTHHSWKILIIEN